MEEFGLADIENQWLAEKREEELAEMPDDFYADSADYFAELSRELETSESLRKEILRRELGRVYEMVQDIFYLRMTKMKDSICEGCEAGAIEEETRAGDKIRTVFSELRKELLDLLEKKESKLSPPEDIDNILVLFLEKIPEPIIGSDMNCYGPFEKRDVANIPRKTADLFVKQGMAKNIMAKEVG